MTYPTLLHQSYSEVETAAALDASLPVLASLEDQASSIGLSLDSFTNDYLSDLPERDCDQFLFGANQDEPEFCSLEGQMPDPDNLTWSDGDFAFHLKSVPLSPNGTLQLPSLKRGVVFYTPCPLPPHHLIQWEVINVGRSISIRNSAGAVHRLYHLHQNEYVCDLPLQFKKLTGFSQVDDPRNHTS